HAIVARGCNGLGGKSGIEEDWIKEVAGTIAGEGPPGAIRTVCAGSEAQREHAGVGIPEGRDGPAPVFPIAIGAAANGRDVCAMIAQTLTSIAGDNAGVELIELCARGRHTLILGEKGSSVGAWRRSVPALPAGILGRSEPQGVMAKIEGIFIGGPKALRDARGEWLSSIARRRVEGSVHLGTEGFDGDKVTQPYHGGAEAAECVHLADHYSFWRERYEIHLPHGHL